MKEIDSRHITQRIEQKLKEVILQTTRDYTCAPNFKDKLRQNLHEYLFSVKRNSSVIISPSVLAIHEIKDIEFHVNCGSDEVKASISFDYFEKQNIAKYNGPGYLGNYPGEICEYPENHEQYYRWNEWVCTWEYLPKEKAELYLDDLWCDTKETFSKWGEALGSNGIFNPIWGNGSSGEVFDTNRHANGEKMWGHVSRPSGTLKDSGVKVLWKKLDLEKIYKIIYNISLDIKSTVGYYSKIEALKKETNPEVIEKIIQDTIVEKPMVKVRLKRITHYSYFMNNGFINETGNSTVKDSVVYTNQDKEYILKHLDSLNEQKKAEAFLKFKNR